MVNYRLIGQRIREIRLLQSVTQQQLAESINVSVPYISYIEHAEKKPSLEVLVNISNALGITLHELLSGNQIHNPTDYQTDMDELMADCSQNERRLVFEMSYSLVRILHENDWE